MWSKTSGQKETALYDTGADFLLNGETTLSPDDVPSLVTEEKYDASDAFDLVACEPPLEDALLNLGITGGRFGF